METGIDVSYMVIERHEEEHVHDVVIIEVLVEEENMGGLEGLRGIREREKGEKGEKCEKEIDKSKPKGLEIELYITTTSCVEVIFKKHVVEIIDKGTRQCVMNGVVVGYEFEGQGCDPYIVLVFEDGRRFCNENFGYMFRYYL